MTPEQNALMREKLTRDMRRARGQVEEAEEALSDARQTLFDREAGAARARAERDAIEAMLSTLGGPAAPRVMANAECRAEAPLAGLEPDAEVIIRRHGGRYSASTNPNEHGMAKGLGASDLAGAMDFARDHLAA